MVKNFMKSRWWHLTAAVASLATVGYAVYMATAHHIFMVWLVVAGVYMTISETWKFIVRRKEA